MEVARSIALARPRVKSKMTPSEAPRGASQAGCCCTARAATPLEELYLLRLARGARLGSVGRESVQAYQEERAAIIEHDGYLPRDEAERLAWACIHSARDV